MKFNNVKFFENPFGNSGVVICGQIANGDTFVALRCKSTKYNCQPTKLLNNQNFMAHNFPLVIDGYSVGHTIHYQKPILP
jgi:hypothetical protein